MQKGRQRQAIPSVCLFYIIVLAKIEIGTVKLAVCRIKRKDSGLLLCKFGSFDEINNSQ